MVFSSHVFLFYFLPLVLGLYYVTPQRCRQPLLTLLSYVFYGWANPWFVFLMLDSTLVDYYCGLIITGRDQATGRLCVKLPLPNEDILRPLLEVLQALKGH